MIKTLKLKQIKMKKQNNNKEEITMNKKFGLMLIASMIVFNGSVMAVEIDIIPDEITVTDEEYELLQEALIDFEEEPIATAAGYKSYHKAGNKTGKKAINPGKRGKSRLPYFEKKGKKHVRFTKDQKLRLAKTFGYRRSLERGGKSLKGRERKSGISKLSREKRKRVAKALGFKDVASLEALVEDLDDDEAVEEIELEEEPIAVAAGFRGRLPSRRIDEIKNVGRSKGGMKQSDSDNRKTFGRKKKVAKAFGFRDAAGLEKVKPGTSPVTRSGKKKVAKAFGFRDAAGLEKVKPGTSPVARAGKKKVAKAFGYTDAGDEDEYMMDDLDDDEAVEIEWEEEPIAVASGFKRSLKRGGKKAIKISKGDKKRFKKLFKNEKDAINISKDDHKHLAKMFGFKSPASPRGEEGGEVVLKLDNKQRKLIAKAFGYRDIGSKSSASRGGKKKVKFSKSEKKELIKALKLK
ncbi:MAG: hypothetical protein QF648_04110 [Candidatus Marinimicrobia bacterium]|nr:hypothetical protein [Candidatus Neomarinimicrobiota bacterium]